MVEMTLIEQQILREQGKLREFAALTKERTGLPVNIWVDDSQSYIQRRHGKRIKFQVTHSDSIISTNNYIMACMDLKGNIIKKTYDPEVSELTSKDIKQVRNFVLNNREFLSLLSDNLIDIGDFLEVMIKGGDLVDPLIKRSKIKMIDGGLIPCDSEED